MGREIIRWYFVFLEISLIILYCKKWEYLVLKKIIIINLLSFRIIILKVIFKIVFWLIWIFYVDWEINLIYRETFVRSFFDKPLFLWMGKIPYRFERKHIYTDKGYYF